MQFRYRGFKGVVSVDPAIDERNAWAVRFGVREASTKEEKREYGLKLVFRPSQEKFRAPRDEHVEIVKYSSPTPVCLNKPMIAILDQA